MLVLYFFFRQSEGWSLVSDIRVDADLRESDRRQEEEHQSKVSGKSLFAFG